MVTRGRFYYKWVLQETERKFHIVDRERLNHLQMQRGMKDETKASPKVSTSREYKGVECHVCKGRPTKYVDLHTGKYFCDEHGDPSFYEKTRPTWNVGPKIHDHRNGEKKGEGGKGGIKKKTKSRKKETPDSDDDEKNTPQYDDFEEVIDKDISVRFEHEKKRLKKRLKQEKKTALKKFSARKLTKREEEAWSEVSAKWDNRSLSEVCSVIEKNPDLVFFKECYEGFRGQWKEEDSSD